MKGTLTKIEILDEMKRASSFENCPRLLTAVITQPSRRLCVADFRFCELREISVHVIILGITEVATK
jgi:hypothetical protein